MAFYNKIGGGSSGAGIESVIYVQTAEPTGSGVEDGQYWVKDSGYSLDVVVADTTVPDNLPATCLYISATPGTLKFPFVVSDFFTLVTNVNYGSAYVNGVEKDAEVYFRVDGQWVLRTKWGGTVVISITRNQSTTRYFVWFNEADGTAVLTTKTVSSVYSAFGGVRNRGLVLGYEIDLDAKTITNLSAVSDVNGGVGEYLLRTQSNSGVYRAYLVDMDTNVVVKEFDLSVASFIPCGGTENYIIAWSSANRNLRRVFDGETGLVVDSTTWNLGDDSIANDGTRDYIYYNSVTQTEPASLRISGYDPVARLRVSYTTTQISSGYLQIYLGAHAGIK